MYGRILAISPELAKQIVLAERPHISDLSFTLESNLLDKLLLFFFSSAFSRLLDNIGSLSSIYYKVPEQFAKKLRDMQNLKSFPSFLFHLFSREAEENNLIIEEEQLLTNKKGSDMPEEKKIAPTPKPPQEPPQKVPEPTPSQIPIEKPPPPISKEKNLLDDDSDFISKPPSTLSKNIKIPFLVTFSLPFFTFSGSAC